MRAVAAELRRLAGMVSRTESGIRVGGATLPVAACVEDVAQAVYEWWYLRPTFIRSQAPLLRDLVPLLRAAHAGARHLESGWVVLTTLGRGVCVVARGDVRRVVQPGDYAAVASAASPVAPGDMVHVCGRLDGVDPETGYWATWSRIGEPEGRLSRFYFHLSARSAPAAVHALTRRLPDLEASWSLKAHVEEARYRRVDGIVVYVPAAAEAEARCLIGRVIDDVGHLLNPSTPPLTERLAPGAAYADDPAGAVSFGQHRVRVLAPAVLQLATGRIRGGAALPVLTDALIAAGIDPHRPWREPPVQDAA